MSALPLTKCRNAEQYKANRPPRCRGGRGCGTCRAKWDKKQKQAKWCPRCESFKPRTAEHFAKNATRRDGHHHICRVCDAARHGRPPPKRKFLPAKDPLEAAYEAENLQREKRDLKREHSALINENQKLKREISELVSMQRAPEVYVYKKAKWDRVDAVACGVASDWHVEEEVQAAAVHGLNEYNLDIAKSRAEHYFKNLLSLTDMMARESRVKTLHLSFLGDFFSGHIHEELLSSTLLNPGDAARFVKGLFISGIDFLLKNSPYNIEADLLPGNHGRMTKQMWFSDPTGTSLESFMYHSLAGRYEDHPRVNLRVADHAMVYRRFFEKFTMRLIHGYEVKYNGGVGGLTIPLRKALAQWNNPIRADLTVLGHFHQFFDGGDFLVNGSLIGYNTYAQAIKATYEEPRQAFFLVHARNGGQKSVTAPVWLDGAHQRRA